VLGGVSGKAGQGAYAPLACNEARVLAKLKQKVSDAYEGVYDPLEDYVVEWERKSADRVVCRAKCVFVKPLRPKPKTVEKGSFFEAVNEVFGLTRKPGESVWVTYEAYRTLRAGQKGGYLFVELVEKGKGLP